jgi:hypothetical protein
MCPVLYREHRGRLTLQAGDIPGDPRALDAGERESVDLVLEVSGDFTAHQLSLMTHGEPPWIRGTASAMLSSGRVFQTTPWRRPAST